MTEERRPIEVDDLYKIKSVEDPQFSPDGKWIAFVRVDLDKFENTYTRNIWLSAAGGGDLRQLTRGGKDMQPRWSPDGGTLAFVSSRNEKPQIFLLPFQQPGEARQLTDMPNGAADPQWSPDGSQIAFLSSMNAEERKKEDSGEEESAPLDKLDAKHRKERREEDEKQRYDPYFMWRVPYRVGTRFLDERYTQVYVISTNESKEKIKPRRLTDIDASFGTARWSVDGKYLFTSRQVDVTTDEPFRNQGLYRIEVESGVSEQLTDESHTNFDPIPSPDGKWLAYSRLPRQSGSITESVLRISVMPIDGGDTRDLNLAFDRSPIDIAWSKDSSSIIFSGLNYGDAPIYRVPASGGTVETLLSGRFKSDSISVDANGNVAFTASTPIFPVELNWLAAGSSEYKSITDFNNDFLNEVIVQETHELRFKNPDGEEIQGWYILPVGYEEGKQHPLALNIHGGPHVMWGPSEPSMFHEWQLHAAREYAVFYCNPRGGDGYGEAFLRALHANWGEVAMDDIMAGVDTLLQKGIVDEKRMAITGGSYGGYMTAWIIGHTDRFASAVSQRGVYNLISFYGTSDVPLLISSEFDVEPWEDHELLWKHSPLAYASNIKTPVLIIHSENDYRVPIEQGEQLFAYVRRSGGTVEMVRYPRDGHELSRSGEPKHRVSRLTKMIEWFDKYCMPQSDEA